MTFEIANPLNDLTFEYHPYDGIDLWITPSDKNPFLAPEEDNLSDSVRKLFSESFERSERLPAEQRESSDKEKILKPRSYSEFIEETPTESEILCTTPPLNHPSPTYDSYSSNLEVNRNAIDLNNLKLLTSSSSKPISFKISSQKIKFPIHKKQKKTSSPLNTIAQPSLDYSLPSNIQPLKRLSISHFEKLILLTFGNPVKLQEFNAKIPNSDFEIQEIAQLKTIALKTIKTNALITQENLILDFNSINFIRIGKALPTYIVV